MIPGADPAAVSQAAALPAQWVQHPERSNQLMLRLMRWLSLHLGRRFTRGILAAISLYFLVFSPTARAASGDYLRRVLGRPPRLGERFRHFHYFASTIHDRVFFLNARFDLFQIDIEGEAAVQAILSAGRGAFLMGAHCGSFEAVRAVGHRQPDLKVAMVMYEANARKLNAALAAINPDLAPDIIPLGQLDSMLHVQAKLDAGVAIGVLADRTLGNEPTLSVPFLGTPTAFPVGPMRLAAMLKRPVLFISGLYLGGNRYRITFEPLADFSTVARADRAAAIEAAITAYAACLERQCRASPCNWFNFFDFWQRPPT
jgi:predicted LPLAT superfamily acyltransferase